MNFATMTDIERQNLGAGPQVNYTGELEGAASLYDYDETIKATIELTPTGERYLVELRDGVLVRVKAL
jgi:hypothetical protein